jgi:hypothetical protein
MGSELLVGVLEIDKRQKPDWAAAVALLAGMSDEEVKSAYKRAMDLDDTRLEERGVRLPKMCAALLQALEALRDAWDGASGHIIRYSGAGTEIVIGGGTSWAEESDEACNQIDLFWESGMAQAAGFLDVTPGVPAPAEHAE